MSGFVIKLAPFTLLYKSLSGVNQPGEDKSLMAYKLAGLGMFSGLWWISSPEPEKVCVQKTTTDRKLFWSCHVGSQNKVVSRSMFKTLLGEYGSAESAKGRPRSRDIYEAIPTKYNPKQLKPTPQSEPPRQKGTTSFGKTKDAAQPKKQGPKTKQKPDRSQAYVYPYDVNYLGPQSRHSSLENMSMQYGYSPYAGMHSGPGHSAGRPTRQPPQRAQYDQYGRTRMQRHEDYW